MSGPHSQSSDFDLIFQALADPSRRSMVERLSRGLYGVEARLEIDGVFYAPSNFRVIDRDGAVERFDVPHEGQGLRHQAAEVGRCLRAGRTESEIMPLDETVAIMETLDEIRRQIGLAYPGE